MPIRVEFYAKDQVTASSIVEFALSCGAVLQGYSEIDAPLARPDATPAKVSHGGARSRLDYENVLYVVADRTNNGTPGSIRREFIATALSARKPRNLRAVADSLRKVHPKGAESSYRALIRDLIRSGNLVAKDG